MRRRALLVLLMLGGCAEPEPQAQAHIELDEIVVLPAARPEHKSPTKRTWLEPLRRCDRYGRRRFCDGPRRVRAPSTHAAQWASEVGLGSFQAGAELVRGTPHQSWVDAVRERGIAEPTFPLHWPVDDGRYGRGLQFRGRQITHRGVDVTAQVGTEVRSVAEGVVGYADNSIRGYGNLLVILHGGGEVSAYAHLSEIRVSLGQRIKRGAVVALAGNTGISRGPHLHFEWREGGRPRDPMRRFPDANKPEWMRQQAAR